MEASFPWVRGDLFLVARVDPETGRQQLVMRQVSSETGEVILEDDIDCIHVAITTISPSEFEATAGAPDFQERTLATRSSESLPQVHLSPKEKFKALASWAAGIAEAGDGGWRIETEIEEYAHLVYPIGNRLLRFLALADHAFLPRYLDLIDYECRHEGVRHAASLRANLIPIVDVVAKNYDSIPISPDILEEICDILHGEAGDPENDLPAAHLWTEAGRLRERQGDWAGATAAYQHAVTCAPTDVETWLRLGCAWARGLQDGEKAVGAFEHALALDPSDARAWYHLGATLLDQRNADDAIPPLERAVALDPKDANSWFTLGLAWKSCGRHSAQTTAAWERGASLDPALARAWDRLGLTQWGLAIPAGITGWIEQLISLGPARADTWHAIGLIRERQGNRAAAITAWERAVAIDPGHAATVHDLRFAKASSA